MLMVFSDTSTNQGLLQDVTFWTGVDTNDYSTQERTRNINAWYHKVVTMILQSQDEWDFDDPNHTDYATLTTPMTTNRDYLIPVSEKVLKMKRLSVSYDGTNYYKSTPIDTGEMTFGLGNDSKTDENFEKTSPRHDVKANSIWLYPKGDSDDVAAGGELVIEWTREIDEFTTADTTQEPGFDEPFHRMLSLGASYDWAVKKGEETLAARLITMLDDYEARLRVYYGSKQQDRQKILTPAYGISSYK